ncbi:MAG: insulinase family protein [Phycisphaerae bacterium]|nr:insulinase family protein [Phycisphaerae bacterium]
MEFKTETLENGLTIVGEIMPLSRSAALGFFTRTGGRDETAEISGVSHFLEHMMFKGTKKRTALEVNLEFDRMGANYNAFTSEENTAYYAAVLPEYVDNALELWCDLLRPSLRVEDFTIEKNVILEEIAMYKDLPQFDVLDRCRKLHFGDHQCGNSVLGTVQTITDLKCEQMVDYFNARYSPDNMVLVCVGNIDWDDFVGQVRQHCSSWQAYKPKRILSDFAGTGMLNVLSDEKIQREHICLMASAPSAQSDKRYAASLLSNIIGDDGNSRLYWQLVDTALADSADLEYDSMDGTGAFYCYLSCEPEKADRVLDIAKKVFANIRTNGVSEEELEGSKNKLASAMTLSGELPMGRFVPLGYDWIYRKKYRSLADSLKELQGVTVKDINAMLEQYDFSNLTVQGLGPCQRLG